MNSGMIRHVVKNYKECELLKRRWSDKDGKFPCCGELSKEQKHAFYDLLWRETNFAEKLRQDIKIPAAILEWKTYDDVSRRIYL